MNTTEGRAARAGDLIEIRGIPGSDTRHGVISEVLGEGEHVHYRVRWDEQHESLFFPGSGEGVHVHPPRRRHEHQ